MNRLAFIVAATVPLLVFSPAANAKGCIKGALVGGAAGHMAGHGKLGAAAGCLVGRHNANKRERERSANQNMGNSNTGRR
jgi:hypothetical protein